MTAVPKLIQRFRANEMKKVIIKAGFSASDRTEIPNPFLPVRNEKTKKWIEPQYSLRRQAELVKAARAAGLVHLLPAGPKLCTREVQEAKKSVYKEPSVIQVQATRSPLTETLRKGVFRTDRGFLRTRRGHEYTIPKTRKYMIPEGNSVWYSAEGHKTGYADTQFNWQGTVKAKAALGAEFGARLYAGKKRMFKGHKWERMLEKRRGQIRVRMRDMGKRIQRFKNTYRKRRPRPLSPAVPRKKESLPF